MHKISLLLVTETVLLKLTSLPWRCCLDSTICCIKHCVCLVTHLGHLHRCASFLYHVHYCTHWILLDFALFWKQATHSLSSSAQRIMASIIFLFFKLAPILVKRRKLWILHFRECFIFLFAQKVSLLFFLPKNIQISLILVKYNVSYNVPWYFKMSIYVTKIIKISQWSILYVALFSVKIWVFNDLSMIAFCFYLHFAQPL